MTTTVLAYIPSPPQGVWQLGPVPLRAYALFIIVGIVAALMIGDRRWEARGGERGVIYDIALWAVPFGLIGGRLYHVITDWWRYFGDGGAGLAGVIRIWDGGLGIWGAVAFGGVGAWIACRRRGIPLPAFGDAIAPGIILAQGIGRLGNYFNQELYGRETTLPWGLEIYERRNSDGLIDNLNGVSTGEVLQVVHPTFLYELLWNLLVFVALIYLDRRFKLGHGRLFAMYVAGYCLGRFWIELLRVDDATLIDGVRINSFTSTFVFIGAVVYIMVAPKGREDPATLKGKPVSGEDVTEELAAVGATAGVVAAAKVAVDDEEKAEDGDDASKSEAEIEAEKLTADVLTAPSEDIAEAEEFAKAGEEADEAEELGADVAGVPADDLAEAEEFAAEGEPEPLEEPDTESEAAAEAEALAEDVEEAPAEDIVEAQEFAEAKEDAETEAGVDEVDESENLAAELDEAADAMAEEEAVGNVADEAGEPEAEGEDLAAELDEAADAMAEEEAATEAADEEAVEPEAGVGAVEGEEAVEAEAAAPEAHEAAVEGLEEAEDVAAEVHDGADEAEEVDEAAAPEAGVGAVEGEEAVEAEAAAPEAHEAAVEGLEEAEDVAAEVHDGADEAEEVDEAAAPEAGVGAVEGEEAVETEAAAPEAYEAAVEGLEEAEDVAAEVHDGAEEVDEAAEPETDEAADEADAEVVEANTEQDTTDTEQSKTVSVEPATESGGRLRRWIRRRRST
ncbi:prolipoprotein diacylglyceryl transferase [Mycolicibacterium pulveris]|uniref:prolipoprotein diacylglyceryl transferase n=2 Tax=Mycolicibacterium pulveris TaxID=36813 RepID=UPI003CED782B